MTINTMDDVREYVAIHSDDDALDAADLEACFRLVFDRDPDDEDRRLGLWSLICSEVALPELQVGQRVEGGEGEDHDTGRILSISGDEAEVGWDSGVRTKIPVADLTPEIR